MHPSAWIALVFGALLALPPPGTTSRSRGFCTAWLALATPEKHAVLEAAERAEAGGPSPSACRSGLRPGLRHKLDAECANWSRLMDFEVRSVVDGVLAPCEPPT